MNSKVTRRRGRRELYQPSRREVGAKKKIGRGGYQGHHWEHKESTEDGAAFNEVARSLGYPQGQIPQATAPMS